MISIPSQKDVFSCLLSNYERQFLIWPLGPLSADLRPIVSDSLPCPGRTGTLGSNIYDLGSSITVTDNESAYYACLSKNGIVDISAFDASSQLGILDIKRNSKLLATLKTKTDEHSTNISSIVDLTTTRNACYNKAEMFIPRTDTSVR
ncbi:hypothetical protein BJV82DRAFT_173806 [Fennellomyces sp. T-0311]|nr:hypothetical protein BJV82DRAFT_173806 [Fennellomyces sp. T-0311]